MHSPYARDHISFAEATYHFFRRCGRLLQKLSASSEGFFRRSFPHLRKKPSDFQKKPSDFQKKPSDFQKKPSDLLKKPSDFQKKPSDFQKKLSDLLKKPSDLRRSCAANASPEKRSEGRRHFLRRVPYCMHIRAIPTQRVYRLSDRSMSNRNQVP